MLNPTTPFLVRDGWPGKAPYVVATYDWGKEVRKELPKDEAQIDATVRACLGGAWRVCVRVSCLMMYVCMYVRKLCGSSDTFRFTSTPLHAPTPAQGAGGGGQDPAQVHRPAPERPAEAHR